MLNIVEFLSIVQKVKYEENKSFFFSFLTLCTLLEEWMQIYVLGLRPRMEFKRKELTGSGELHSEEVLFSCIANVTRLENTTINKQQ